MPKPAKPGARPTAGGLPLAARIDAAARLLDRIAADPRPADAVIAAFLRETPALAGSDRGSVLDLADNVLHRRAALDWWIARTGHGLPADGRSRLIVYLALVEGRKPDAIERAFAKVGPAPALGGREQSLVAGLAGKSLLQAEMPLAARCSFPAWLEADLRRAFGSALEVEMQALATPAPLDFRVNSLKASRAETRAALAKERLQAQPTPLSPIGLRLPRGIDLGQCRALQDGLVEPQDEGSQIAALLVDARPGQFVVDYCAGAGGKTLALAAMMQNHGRLIAADVSAGRLERAKLRLRRAGVHNAECRDSGERKWFKRQAGRADRVLVDAPCTGIGSWRRIPDARWRLQPTDLPELLQRQREILDAAAVLVRPGGRLIYVTCSVLPQENEEQVAQFIGRHPDFAPLPVADLWPQVIEAPCPAAGPWLQLTPARHGTGGFFVAILERRTALQPEGGDSQRDPAGQ